MKPKQKKLQLAVSYRSNSSFYCVRQRFTKHLILTWFKGYI